MHEHLISQSEPILKLVVWGGLGIAALTAFVVALVILRRRLLGGSESKTTNLLDLETLQQMRDNGTITEQEYKALRGVAIQALDQSLGK